MFRGILALLTRDQCIRSSVCSLCPPSSGGCRGRDGRSLIDIDHTLQRPYIIFFPPHYPSSQPKLARFSPSDRYRKNSHVRPDDQRDLLFRVVSRRLIPPHRNRSRQMEQIRNRRPPQGRDFQTQACRSQGEQYRRSERPGQL